MASKYRRIRQHLMRDTYSCLGALERNMLWSSKPYPVRDQLRAHTMREIVSRIASRAVVDMYRQENT